MPGMKLTMLLRKFGMKPLELIGDYYRGYSKLQLPMFI
jgi:hypothetical protein